jgi:sporulation protein YlmC with PRC-barrel domain
MHMEITSLLDLDVYTQNGAFVGRVDDLVLDLEEGAVSSLALGQVNRSFFDTKGKGVIIPYSLVTAVGDIALMKNFTTRIGKDEKKI